MELSFISKDIQISPTPVEQFFIETGGEKVPLLLSHLVTGWSENHSSVQQYGWEGFEIAQ
jgi:hypothetical protein